MTQTAAWSVFPQMRTLQNGAVVLTSGRPSIGLWVLDTATLLWTNFLNLAAAHNRGLPKSGLPQTADFFFNSTMQAKVNSSSSPIGLMPQTKAYTGLDALPCRPGARSCGVLVSYDRLANDNQGPPGPNGDYDRVFSMQVDVVAPLDATEGSSRPPADSGELPVSVKTDDVASMTMPSPPAAYGAGYTDSEESPERAREKQTGREIGDRQRETQTDTDGPRRRKVRFSAQEFERLRQTLHTLSREDAERRFAEVEPLASPPPRQRKIDHMVVLFMENRAFDHVLGCIAGNKPGVTGIPRGGRQIPVDGTNLSKGFVNITCGTAQQVCTGGGAYDTFSPKFAPPVGNCGPYGTGNCGPSLSPYRPQSDNYSVLHIRSAADIAPSVSSFSQEQLPVKTAIVNEFGLFNKYFTSVPSYSSPNHFFAQSATSCGVHDNIMYSSCGGKTDTFPMLTIFDSLYLHNVSFGLYMNSSCGLLGQPGCHSESPHTADAGSPFNMPDVAMSGVGRHKAHFRSQTEFFHRASEGSLPALSWMIPPEEACDHPCFDVAKGDRWLKDVYEAVRAGPGWEKTLVAVVYDDTGGWYDQVVPPHGPNVPNDEAPCNVNITSKCQGESGNKQNDAFDFKRLGLRAPALLISPWVQRGAVFQEPACSAAQHRNGSCPDSLPTLSTAQFEHSSLPATIKSLFNLTSFLTKRDAWAGDFSELLLDAPRTDTPVHLPDALAPAAPWCSQLTASSMCAKNEACTWNATTKLCQEGNPPMPTTQRRRQLSGPGPQLQAPQHCSARTGTCQASGTTTARHHNRMATLGSLTGVSPPREVDATAANAWLAARWREYMGE
jgi:phospholipase C